MERKSGFSIYDPTMGSGSLLLQAKNFLLDTDEVSLTDKIQYFGQEMKNQTYNLARMNMILHKVSGAQQHLRQGDTLGVDWPTDEPTNFDAVVMNPLILKIMTLMRGFSPIRDFLPTEAYRLRVRQILHSCFMAFIT